MNGAISLDDLQSSGNGGSSTDTENTSDSGSEVDALEAVCEELGAEFEHAKEYVDEHGNKDDLVEFAKTLKGNDELFKLMEEYRRGNDVHRIIRNHLRSLDPEFTQFTGQFYGDSDDPAEGTYNDVQQRSRESEGNLMWYRALFPFPNTDYWDHSPVCWQEFDSIGYSDGQQDSHIFVTQQFAEEYMPFAREIDGEERPVPPSNEQLEGGSGSTSNGGAVIDPAEYTVDALRAKLDSLLEEGVSSEKLAALEAVEAEGKDRKTAKKAIRGAANQMSDREASAQEDGSTSNGGDSEQSELSDAAKAGEVNSGQADIPPEKVMELMDSGWSKDEIIEFYG